MNRTTQSIYLWIIIMLTFQAVSGSAISISSGDVQGRIVESWPEIPEYTGKDVGKVVLKFWVTPQGDVFNVQAKLKAGNPLLVKLAKRFVEDIKFAPLPKGAKQKNQWGEITIDFITPFSRKKVTTDSIPKKVTPITPTNSTLLSRGI